MKDKKVSEGMILVSKLFFIMGVIILIYWYGIMTIDVKTELGFIAWFIMIWFITLAFTIYYLDLYHREVLDYIIGGLYISNKELK